MTNRTLKPQEILDVAIASCAEKASAKFLRLAILSFLAGVFIAFASEGSNMAAFNLLARPETYGLGKALAGSIFGAGLMLVILAGGELFTGSTLMLAGVCSRRIRTGTMLRSWLIIYAGNFIGALFIAVLLFHSGLFSSGDGMLGAVTLKIAVAKVNLTFLQALILGTLCNWLVCLAVWLSLGADTMAGKILAVFFPIWLFITSGFEHSVANMYYIPAGMLAARNETFVTLSHVPAGALEALNWQGFLYQQPVAGHPGQHPGRRRVRRHGLLSGLPGFAPGHSAVKRAPVRQPVFSGSVLTKIGIYNILGLAWVARHRCLYCYRIIAVLLQNSERGRCPHDQRNE